jgi:hypothetical protein
MFFNNNVTDTSSDDDFDNDTKAMIAMAALIHEHNDR